MTNRKPSIQRKASAASAHQTGSHPAKGATTEPPKPIPPTAGDAFQGVPFCPPGREGGFGSASFLLHWTPYVFSLICLIYAGLAAYEYHLGHMVAAFFMVGAAVTVGAAAIWLFGDRPKDDG